VALVHTAFRRAPLPLVGGVGRLPQIVFVLMWCTVWLGTVVTGSGPHAGDAGARRTGLDPELLSHAHAIAVYVTIGMTLITMIILRSRQALLLLAIEVGQGLVGFVQYYNGLPVPVVALHLLGAAVAMAGAAHLLLCYRRVPHAVER